MKQMILTAVVAFTLFSVGTVLFLKCEGMAGGARNGVATDEVVPNKTLAEWVEALKSADPSARKGAAVALASFGSAGKSAVPALGKSLQD